MINSPPDSATTRILHALQRHLVFFKQARADFNAVDKGDLERRVQSVREIIHQIHEHEATYCYFGAAVGALCREAYDLMHAKGRWGDVLADWPPAIEIARGFTDSVTLAILVMQCGIIAGNQASDQTAEQYYREALKILEGNEDEYAQSIIGQILFNLGANYVDRGKNRDARQVLRDCMSICERVHDRLTWAFACVQVGNIALQDGKTDEAIRVYLHVLQVWNEIGEQDRMAHTSWYGLGKAYLFIGRYGEAVDAFKRSIAIKQVTDPTVEGLASCYNWLGVALVRQGNLSEGEAYLERALREGADLSDRECIINARVGLALAARQCGELSKAIAHLTECLADLEKVHIAMQKIRVAFLLLPLLVRSGKTRETITLLMKLPRYVLEQQISLVALFRLGIGVITGRFKP